MNKIPDFWSTPPPVQARINLHNGISSPNIYKWRCLYDCFNNPIWEQCEHFCTWGNGPGHWKWPASYGPPWCCRGRGRRETWIRKGQQRGQGKITELWQILTQFLIFNTILDFWQDISIFDKISRFWQIQTNFWQDILILTNLNKFLTKCFDFWQTSWFVTNFDNIWQILKTFWQVFLIFNNTFQFLTNFFDFLNLPFLTKFDKVFDFWQILSIFFFHLWPIFTK